MRQKNRPMIAKALQFTKDVLDQFIKNRYGLDESKVLNSAILFFQIHPMLDSSAYSTIPAGLHKLEYEIEKLGYHQMHSLWTAMGAKYQPSVIYKVRLITIQGNEAESFAPGVTQTSTVAAL